MADILYVDYEAVSACDIKRFGTYKYAKHPTTRFICMAWAFNDEPVEIWKAQEADAVPERVLQHMEAGGEVWAHNAIFERLMTNRVGQRYGFPKLATEQMVCTLVQCANMALPLSLENAATALCLPERKDMEKRKVAVKIWKPISVDPVTGEPTFATPETHPAEFQANYDYCMGDVEVERAIAKQVRRISPLDARIYAEVDQPINDRGIKVDIPLVKIMKRLAEREKDRLNAELEPLCGLKFTQTAKLGEWVKGHGIPVPALDKHQLSALLARTDLPGIVRQALEIRQEANKSSVAKLDAMLDRCEEDGRARGLFQFKGAVSTGRFGHRAIQTGNMPRPELSAEVIETILDWLSKQKPEDDLETLDTIRVIWGRPTHVFSDCLRGLLIPEGGKVFVGPDLVSIESLVGAWLVGDDAKVAYMAAGGDVYKQVARLILGLAPFRGWVIGEEGVPITKLQRQLYGKVPELSLGYQGGWREGGAIWKFCEAGGLPFPGEPEAKRWQTLWREIHPKYVQYWEDIDQAATAAVLNAGAKFGLGPPDRRVEFRVQGRFLMCRIPSGSVLCYPFPRVEKKGWREGVTYMKSKDKQWFRNSYYGGHGFENVDQACAKDLLTWGMLNLEEEGFPVVTHSHDEAVPEVEDRVGLEEEACAIFTRKPEWAATLPYTSSAFKAKRYRK